MKRKKLKQPKLLLLITGLAVLLIVVITSSSTFSSLIDSDEKQNDLRIGDLKTTIEEDFDSPATFIPDQEYSKKVKIKNVSDQSMFLRVLVSPMISKKDSDGTTILLPSTTDGTVPVLTIDYNTIDWINGNDGYFYYKKKLIKGESTPYLFTKVTMNKVNITEKYDGVNLTFDLKAEAINCTQFAYRDAWWNSQIPTDNPLLGVDNELKNQTI